MERFDVQSLERFVDASLLAKACLTCDEQIQIRLASGLENTLGYLEYVAGFESNLYKQVEWINDNVPVDIATEHLTLHEKSWETIKVTVLDEPNYYDKSFRGARIREIEEETPIHKSTLYRYLRKYWHGGKIKYGCCLTIIIVEIAQNVQLLLRTGLFAFTIQFQRVFTV